MCKRLGAKITRVVVSKSHGIKMALEKLQTFGRDAKDIGFVFFRRADGSDHALQVANADIGVFKKRSEAGKRVLAFAHGLAWAVFQHDVAHDH